MRLSLNYYSVQKLSGEADDMNRPRLWLTSMLALLVLLASCSPGPRSAQEEPEPTPIPTPIVPAAPTYVVQRGEVVRQIEFTARVAPVTEARLFFRSDGFVRAVHVAKGAAVKTGDLLAELETASLERGLAKAEHELKTAQEKLAEAEQKHQDDLARAELQLQLAKARLTAAQTQARADLAIKRQQLAKAQLQDPTPQKARAEAELEQARITLQQAQAAYDAIAWRNDAGASFQAANLQQATLDYQKAQATCALAMQEISTHANDLAILEQEVALAELEVGRLEDSDIDTDSEQAAALAQLDVDVLARGVDPELQRQVTTAQLQVDDIKAQIAEARIVAPFDGAVTSIAIAPGRAVEAYQPVLIVADLTDLEISAELSAEQMRDLTEGLAVSIAPTNYPGQELAGSIRQLPYPYGRGGGAGTLEDADKATRISLDFARLPAGVKLASGDLVRVTVVIERKADVLWLPPAAIRTFGGRKFVVIQDGAAQRRMDVTVGIESEERVEIRSGVEEGEVILGQ